MNDFTDRTLARHLLETREQGLSFPLFFSRTRKNYALRALCFLGPLPICVIQESWTVFCLLLGIFLGSLLMDVSWFRLALRTWSFNVKVTDWDKVRKLAEDEQPSTP